MFGKNIGAEILGRDLKTRRKQEQKGKEGRKRREEKQDYRLAIFI